MEVVKYLLSEGADIEATFKTGFTSLYIAAQKGHLEVVKTLVEYGANIDAAAEHGATPLYIASQNGHKEVVQYLISKGANIEVKVMEISNNTYFFVLIFSFFKKVQGWLYSSLYW